MTNPFKKLVGLKGIATADSYVNDLPGLSVELVDALTSESDDEEDVPALEVWNRIHNAAFDRLESEIVGCLSADSTFTSLIARTCEVEPIDGLPTTPVAQYEGVHIRTPTSPNSRVRLMNLVFMAEINANVTATLIVADTRRGTVLKHQEVIVVPGVNIIPIGYDYPLPILETPQLFVGINAEELAFLPLSPATWSVTSTAYHIEPAYFAGITTLGLGIPNYFYLEAEHQRTITSVIPRFADQLRLAYMYLCGSLLMTEKLGSVNFNLFTSTNRDFTIEQEEKLMKDFKSAVKPVARLIKQHLLASGNLQRASDTESGYEEGSYV
ncbi:hypothetical protein [Larkinella sp. C7]|uniref:hypothetical protein n=1 Tax=Larkinella sp. C7 TaxID=2576607 RepID=UPI001111324F|nr:hypothetical protein [Larkinella sp. C7]